MTLFWPRVGILILSHLDGLELQWDLSYTCDSQKLVRMTIEYFC